MELHLKISKYKAYNQYLEQISPKRAKVRENLIKGNRLFIAGLREMNPEKKYYPDANSTMRATYGHVGDYKPGEAMHYDYYTTIDGVIQKEDSTNEEFVVPKKLKELYELGDYGRYADKDSNLRVNFISNNDITGGNSGSPVINGQGHLIGCAFDGNWEGMSGDIAFDPKFNRTISVDAKYILFIIDKFAGASHLINEMTLVKSAPKTTEKIENVEEKEVVKNLDVINKNNTIKKTTLSFEEAFLKAWRMGEKTFTWNGMLYTTERADKRVAVE